MLPLARQPERSEAREGVGGGVPGPQAHSGHGAPWVGFLRILPLQLDDLKYWKNCFAADRSPKGVAMGPWRLPGELPLPFLIFCMDFGSEIGFKDGQKLCNFRNA